jgi:hypothetical protein
VKRLAISLAALAALLAAPAAVAHGVGGAQGYVSTLSQLDPPALGVYVDVRGQDDRLRLSNTTGKVLMVEGYEGEPYLRFTPNGVYRNARSPATYLNADRFAQTPVPATADPKADPRWVRVAPGKTYEWHDHRIHWMSTIAPPVVKADPEVRHHVFDWNVPATFDGAPLAIEGSLDYVPPQGSGLGWIVWLAPSVALIVLAVGLVWRRGRRASGEQGSVRFGDRAEDSSRTDG